MSLRTAELKNRVIAKKKMLESRIAELKADTQGKTADEVNRVKRKLHELENLVRNGFDELSEKARKSLKDWLDR